jgi:hypothetical protein
VSLLDQYGSKNEIYDFDSRARSLSSSMYLWAISEKEAHQKLLKIWGEI